MDFLLLDDQLPARYVLWGDIIAAWSCALLLGGGAVLDVVGKLCLAHFLKGNIDKSLVSLKVTEGLIAINAQMFLKQINT